MARSNAMAAARRASTPATLVRYSMVPRLSLIGLQAALRRRVELRQRCLVELVADQRVGRILHQQPRRRHRAEQPRAPRCRRRFASSVTLTPQPTTAMSISVRGMKRR